MASTTNLGIDKINGGDYVDPEAFNKAYDIIDKLGVDYVTASGTSGDWWYRKWKSGRLEQGVTNKNFGDLSHDTAWGSMHVSDNQSFGAFPFAYASIPYAHVTFNKSDDGGHQCFVNQQGGTSTTQSPKFALVDPYTGTATGCQFGIYAVGTAAE